MLIGALEAGGTKMVCSIGKLKGGILQRASFPTTDPETTISQIVGFISQFDVKALGIGSFGPLDLNPDSPTYGHITKTPKAGWSDYPLMPELSRRIGVPTAIDTDVTAAALAEFEMGQEVSFLIGSEGGLSDEECAMWEQKGIGAVTLGSRILRTENAAAYVLPVLFYKLQTEVRS